MSSLCLYYKESPLRDRWIKGDRYLRSFAKKAIREPKKVSSLQKVFNNLCAGFDRLNINYTVNKPFKNLKEDDIVVVLGRGRECLEGYDKPNKIIAGIGLMTHPSEWPTLFDDYPVSVYLQHSGWTKALYDKYYPCCMLWQAGIDTEVWKPSESRQKSNDILIYNKIMWDKENRIHNLLDPIKEYLTKNRLSYQILSYGAYDIKDYHRALDNSRAMIFLCEHESQGLAYQEALSMGVPIFAWQQGRWLDPNRFKYEETDPIQADSVPFFDDTCGIKFSDLQGFISGFDQFYRNVLAGNYNPRNYILNTLSLEKSAYKMLEIIKSVSDK